jgi:hypothetical protein
MVILKKTEISIMGEGNRPVEIEIPGKRDPVAYSETAGKCWADSPDPWDSAQRTECIRPNVPNRILKTP